VAHQENPFIAAASYLSPQDVALIYSVSYRTVLQWIRTGELEAYQLAGRLYRIPPEALDHLAQPVVRDLSLRTRNQRVLALPVQSTARAKRSRP
jgi:excisionase family DNA binding protein